MEKFKVSFEANNQQLKSHGTKHASDTYADIEATFVLGSRWTDMDSVSAVWWNDFTRIATVLDSDGKCIVPHEVLTRKGYVRVNLVGSVVENGELVTRLTSYSAEAVKVNEKIKLTGSETSELTPSQFEQFVTEVKADADRAETVRDEAEAARDVAVSAKDTAVNAVEGFEDIVDTATATAVQTIQGEGATQVTAIQTEGTTQVASVRTEGSTQVTAVQDKGDEVLDSIPADYTQLSQNVTDLKSDLNFYSEVTDTVINDDGVCLADESGNILGIISDGGLCTNGFKSSQKKHINSFTFNRTSTTKYINKFFPKGTELALHIANYSELNGMTSSVEVTYFYIDSSGVKKTLGQEYGYSYYKAIMPEDAYSIGVDCPPGLTPTEPKNLAFCVFEIPSFSPKPNEVHIASDGSGDYTSLRAAVESITDANRYNPYILYIHKGTYNILSDYTNDEISATGFQGFFLKDGMSLIGVGNPDDIIIHGELDTDTYDLTKRNDVSAINVVGNVTIQNLTVTAKNIRYAIHDDTGTAINNKVDVYYEDLRLSGSSMTSGSNNFSYGAGCSYMKTLHFKNCDFGSAMVIHSANSITMSGHIYMENCSARFYNFGDYNSGVPTYVKMRNCKAQFINLELDYGPHSQFIDISGEGTCGAMVGCESGYIYNLGDCIEFTDQSISAGYAVKLNHIYGSISTTSNINDMYGISLGTKNGSTIVQFRGYINSNVLGLSGLSVGDYLTLNSSGAVVVGGTENNAIAKVALVYNNVAYAKLIN